MTRFPIRYFVLMVTPLIHSGCGTGYNEGFDCPAGIGVGCKSLSDVNDMANHNRLPSQREKQQDKDFLKFNAQTIDSLKKGKSIKVWIPDFKDEAGRIHEPHYVHEVLPAGLNIASRIKQTKKINFPLMEV